MSDVQLGVIETKIPSRLDRLTWSRFHWRIVLGLGTAWVLDGLEVTIVGSVASRLTEHGSGISITSAGIGEAAALYVLGACLGALFFGHMTDRYGRKKLFMITLALYMAATAVTAISFSAWFFFLFRFLTGAGIGGEYAAINSAIDELIPARARGRIDLVINGSFWIGSILGSALAIFFLDEAFFPADIGWRLTFVLGLILASGVMLVRRHVPESPRWLFIHGREQEAEALVDQIEADVAESTGTELEPVERTLTVRQRTTIPFRSILRTAVKVYPRRSILCLALFVGQAFIYNGITFNLGDLMHKFFGVSSGITPVFLILYAGANFMGPLLLGRFFDTVGRIPMITGTYLGSSLLGLLLAGLFAETGAFDRWSFIVVVMATFFLASAGASAAYLTSSEIFPMETRALAIAFFYAIGTAVGGIAGPLLFGPLIGTGSRGLVGLAFFIGSVLMATGAAAELAFGVKAERQQLEDIAKPLTAEEAEQEGYVSTRGTLAASGARNGPTAAPSAAAAAAAAAGRPDHHLAAEHRAKASDYRAEAADHRARLYELLVDGGAPEGALQVEDTLAQISEARALAEDEWAADADADADIDVHVPDGSGGADGARTTDGAGGVANGARDTDGAASRDGTDRQLSTAAHHRATSHEEDALALSADDEAEAERHRQLASAALERARAAEQRAAAEERRARAAGAHPVDQTTGANGGADDDSADDDSADDDSADDDSAHGARADRGPLHEAWAVMHEERALAFESRAQHRDEEAARHDQAAERMAAQARAISFRLEAAEHRGAANNEREHAAAEMERIERQQRDRQWRAELRRQAAEDDERIRARLARQRERQAAGVRRYRPGPGRLGRPPGVLMAPAPAEEALDHEILSIERALYDHGPTDRGELARMVGGRYWGPGVFAEALRQAVADGNVVRLTRRVYAPAPSHEQVNGGSAAQGA